MAGMNRRDFFKMVGITGAATAAGCDARVPTENVIPYVVHPEEVIPGQPTFYATVCGGCSTGCGAVARAREGRVVQLMGNADSPVGQGGICSRGIAEVQETYDPDRATAPSKGGAAVSWDDAVKELGEAVKGGGVAWLGRYRTGSLGQLISDFVAAAGGARVHWEPLGYEALATATKQTFGVEGLPRYVVGPAHTVVSFGADFLQTWLSPVDHAKGWGVARDPSEGGFVAEFFALEPRISNSSAKADTWWRTNPGAEAGVAWALARMTAEAKGNLAKYPVLSNVDAAALAQAGGVDAGKLKTLAEKLAANTSVVFPGGVSTQGTGATDLAVATLVLNHVCGNIGATVMLGSRHDLGQVNSFADAKALLADCAAGKIKTLFIDALDPAFSMPADLNVADALSKVTNVVVLNNSAIEGQPSGAMLLPPGSALESWGDSSSVVGVWGLQQPAMRKLHDTMSVGDLLLEVARAAGLKAPEPEVAEEDEGTKDAERRPQRGKAGKAGRPGAAAKDAVRADGEEEAAEVSAELGGQAVVNNFEAWDFQRYIAGQWLRDLFPGSGASDFQTWWTDCLQRGGYSKLGREPSPAVQGVTPAAAAQSIGGDYKLILFADPHLFDGRGANKAWLQEIPDSLSGYTWGTWAEISPATAAKLGVDETGTVNVKTDAGSAELGVKISKGVADDVVAVNIGNGHAVGNRYSKGWGFNASRLVSSATDEASGAQAWLSAGASLSRGAAANPMHDVNGHEDMDNRIVAHATYAPDVLSGKGDGPGSLARTHNIPEDDRLVEKGIHDFYPVPEHPNYRFGLNIDLDSCTGCGACQAACYSENNIPVVGPEQQQKSRNMSWIRMDRFWQGEGEHPDVRFFPAMCQHCNHAPCEGVCPVLATYHNLDGMNAMIYNRCVGTRYCANNCPYSARRFNYHTFRWPSSYNLMLNPDVSTREMGVMEKCSFCIQRVRYTKAIYRAEGGAPDSALKKLTACAEACPSDAIVFGNLKDESAEVTKRHNSARSYALFGELNTKPGVQYTTKLVFQEPVDAHHGGGHGDDHGAGHDNNSNEHH